MGDNYAITLEAARLRFLSRYSQMKSQLSDVFLADGILSFPFLGTQTHVITETGHVFFSYDGFQSQWQGNFEEALCVYDWLCDRKPDAVPSGEYCPVHSLPGVLVRGKGLAMNGGALLPYFDQYPERLRQACRFLGGQAVDLGDIGFSLPVFPNLSMILKFYHGDIDFPPAITLLWDKNTLNFLKYETIYYAADCLLRRLAQHSGFLPGETA